MTSSSILSLVFAMTCLAALAVPAASNASSDRPQRVFAHVQRIAHRHAMPSTAEALSPSMLAPAPARDDDADGLTRNIGECNRGCIDSN